MFLTTYDVMKKEKGIKVPKTLGARWIEPHELDELYKFMEKIRNEMGDNKNFALEPQDTIFIPYEMGGKILGLFDEEGKIVGERYITLIDHGKSDLLIDASIDARPDEVLYLKSTVIDTDYTGNSLQYKTLIYAIDYLKKHNMTKFMSTISPYNIFSLNSAIKGNFKIRALKKKYPTEEYPNGLWRCILYLDTESEEKYDTDYIYVNRKDVNRQVELLEDDYVGIILSDDKEEIGYAKILK